MEARQKSKTKEIEKITYRLDKPDARTSCWLFTHLGSRADQGSLFKAMGNLPKDDFDYIFTLALSHIFRMDTKDGSTFPTAVVLNGNLVDPLFKDDETALMDVVSEWVVFVIDPYKAANA